MLQEFLFLFDIFFTNNARTSLSYSVTQKKLVYLYYRQMHRDKQNPMSCPVVSPWFYFNEFEKTMKEWILMTKNGTVDQAEFIDLLQRAESFLIDIIEEDPLPKPVRKIEPCFVEGKSITDFHISKNLQQGYDYFGVESDQEDNASCLYNLYGHDD